MMGSEVYLHVNAVEEQRYYEFSNALLEGDVLALADVALEGQVQPDETPVLFHFSTTLMLSMMDPSLSRGSWAWALARP